MKYIVLDLEMNRIRRRLKVNELTREIIEIGAIAMNEAHEEIGSFMTYVHPDYNEGEIEEVIQHLTGITTEMVSQSPGFATAMESFLAWLAGFQDEILLIEWSDSDKKQLMKEIRLKEYTLEGPEKNLLEQWYDLQKAFGEVIGLTRQVSLEDALMYTGDDFEGKQHDALYDARNTAHLYAMISNPADYKAELKKVIDYLHPEPIGVSIGDMFDFSKLK